MADIVHLLRIEATADQVFAAITQIDGLRAWWTPQCGGAGTVGSILTFDFDERYHNEMRVEQLVPNKRVVWKCLVGDRQWRGTELSFLLETEGAATILRFRHGGWARQSDFFAQCNYQWGFYMRSLAAYCETGRGSPYGGSS